MWAIYRSKALQAVHLSGNEIPNKILRSLLFVFGIHNANEGDLFDASNARTIERYKTDVVDAAGEADERLLSFIPLQDEVKTKDQARAKITNTEIIKQVADQKTYLLTT